MNRPTLAMPKPKPPVWRKVPWTDLVLSLLSREPEGMTSAQIGKELDITSDGASRVAQKLHTQGRILAEMQTHERGQTIYVWKAKTNA